jgi:hypothetical protein
MATLTSSPLHRCSFSRLPDRSAHFDPIISSATCLVRTPMAYGNAATKTSSDDKLSQDPGSSKKPL